MQPVRQWARGITLRALLACVMLTAALPAGAQESSGTAEPFLKDKYYLGNGNTPPTLTEYCAAPLTYMRSEAANRRFLAGIADELGRSSLSRDTFCALVEDGRVRTETPCAGRFHTFGILPNGEMTPSSRACYTDERLIEVDVDGTGNWVVVASQGCYNPDRTPPPEPETCRWVQTSTNTEPTHVYRNEGLEVCDCVDIPGSTAVIPDSTSTGYTLVCE